MASFKFDFGDNIETNQHTEGSAINGGNGKVIAQAQSQEFIPPSSGTIDLQYEVVTLMNGLTLRKRTFGDIKVQIATRDDLSAETNRNDPLIQSIVRHTDLIKGSYEGGFKTWEGAFDLLTHITNSELRTRLKGKSVLEIGCGSGLPGILALLFGASRVDFQDYNLEVLELSTFPNLLLNSIETSAHIVEPESGFDDTSITWQSRPASSRFFSGDWTSLCTMFANDNGVRDQYDFIFTSDTIYEYDNLRSLLELIHITLKPGGRAYIAAKSNYFGCSGSLATFMQATSQFAPAATIRSVFRHEDTVCREVLEYIKS